MVVVVNKDLFSTDTKKKSGSNGDFFATSYLTPVEIEDRQSGDKFKRLISVVNHSSEELNKENTRIRIKPLKPGRNQVQIRQSPDYKFDSDIYLIAVPFNGVLLPIEESYSYRILSGFVVNTLKNPVMVGKQKFGKIAYMIVTLNKGLFAEDNKHHTDQLELVVKSRFDKIKKQFDYQIVFTPDGKWTITNTPIDTSNLEEVSVDKNTSVFPIYCPPEKNENEEKKPYRKEHTPEKKQNTAPDLPAAPTEEKPSQNRRYKKGNNDTRDYSQKRISTRPYTKQRDDNREYEDDIEYQRTNRSRKMQIRTSPDGDYLDAWADNVPDNIRRDSVMKDALDAMINKANKDLKDKSHANQKRYQKKRRK